MRATARTKVPIKGITLWPDTDKDKAILADIMNEDKSDRGLFLPIDILRQVTGITRGEWRMVKNESM